MRIRLDQAVEDHLGVIKHNLGARTVKGRRTALRRLVASCGGLIYVDEIGDAQVSRYLDEALQKRKPTSMRPVYTALNEFFAWAGARNYLGPSGNPMARRKAPKPGNRKHHYLPAGDLPQMLRLAQHPRDRMVYATGWHLLLRAGEMNALKVGDYSPKRGLILVQVEKKGEPWEDEMSVGPRLGEELEDWLKFYSDHMQKRGLPLEPSFQLVPAKANPKTSWVQSTDGRMNGRTPKTVVSLDDPLKQTSPMSQVEKIIRRGLVSVGFPEVNPRTGEKIRIGEHDLRRSGGRALYESLVKHGIPNAIQVVQAQFHHTTEQQTREYIDVEVDTEYRNRILADFDMYDDTPEVTDLGEARALRESQDSSM
jgi:integrase